jgi:hypothetical protein
MMGRYQWPASRLDKKEMALLFNEKQRTGKSICELLRIAVHTAYGNIKIGKEGCRDEEEK